MLHGVYVCVGGGWSLERLKFRSFETSNIKRTQDELFDFFIFVFIFYFHICLRDYSPLGRFQKNDYKNRLRKIEAEVVSTGFYDFLWKETLNAFFSKPLFHAVLIFSTKLLDRSLRNFMNIFGTRIGTVGHRIMWKFGFLLLSLNEK